MHEGKIRVCTVKRLSPPDGPGRLSQIWCLRPKLQGGSERDQQADQTDAHDTYHGDLIFDLLVLCGLKIGQDLLHFLGRRLWINVKMNHVHGIWFGERDYNRCQITKPIYPGQQYKYIPFKY